MSTVLIDNWNLVNANLTKDIKGNCIPNDAYSDLLSALLLWDDVCYLDEGFSTFGWIYDKRDIKEFLTPLYIDMEVRKGFEQSSNSIFCNNYQQDYNRTVAQRAIYYSEISKAFQMNYLPVGERADFLQNNMNIMDLWSRNEVIKEEEKEILLKSKR